MPHSSAKGLAPASGADSAAECVEHLDAGEGERGAFMETQERVAKLRAHFAGSSGEPDRA